MKHTPFALTTLRLLLGPAAILCAISGVDRWVYLPILVVGTLSDIFDGIIARRLGVATPALRRYDSVTDIIYYVFVLAALCVVRKPAIVQSWLPIALLVTSEAVVIAVSFTRFRKYPAAHSYLAKFYGLCMLAALVLFFVFDASAWCLIVLAVVALVANGEIVAIHLLSKAPPVDVRSIFSLLAQRSSRNAASV